MPLALIHYHINLSSFLFFVVCNIHSNREKPGFRHPPYIFLSVHILLFMYSCFRIVHLYCHRKELYHLEDCSYVKFLLPSVLHTSLIFKLSIDQPLGPSPHSVSLFHVFVIYYDSVVTFCIPSWYPLTFSLGSSLCVIIFLFLRSFLSESNLPTLFDQCQHGLSLLIPLLYLSVFILKLGFL